MTRFPRYHLYVSFVFGTLFLIFSLSADAAITGVCANCHVMHAQESDFSFNPDKTITYGDNGTGSSGGNDMLLEAGTCLGCHGASASGASGAPIVEHSSDPVNGNNQLAGGDFYWEVSGDRYVHNVTELSNVDDIWNGVNPPGWDGTNFTAHNGGIGSTWTNQLTCAGVYGCHGTHVTAAPVSEVAAMNGAHHKNISGETWRTGGTLGAATGVDIGKSYRFLLGIKGLEDDDYEIASSVSANDGDHNIYYGENRATESAPATNDTASQTISYFCGQCHGAFHSGSTGTGLVSNVTFQPSGTISANTWIRHPVDFAMVTTGEYALYTTYDLSAPVGSSDTADTSMTAIAVDRIVTCLSCHLAHGSKFEHILRFADQTMIVGSGVTTGCLACHSDKRS